MCAQLATFIPFAVCLAWCFVRELRSSKSKTPAKSPLHGDPGYAPLTYVMSQDRISRLAWVCACMCEHNNAPRQPQEQITCACLHTGT
jgi:hypothetical protein